MPKPASAKTPAKPVQKAQDATKPAPKRAYRLKKGVLEFVRVGIVLAGPEATVDLTEAEAKPHLDVIELVTKEA